MSYEPRETESVASTMESHRGGVELLEPESTSPVIEYVPESLAAGNPSLPDVPVPTLRERFAVGLNYPTTLWMIGLHVAAVFAFWHFSWEGLIAMVAMHFVSACLGVTLGYHRLLTHGSFATPSFVKYFCSVCGMLSAEGSPLLWVATHRQHHAHSDENDDPHSPNHGFWWSHMLWFMPYDSDERQEALFRRWAPDMLKDPVQRFFHRWFGLFSVGSAALTYGIGEYFFQNGLSFFLWGHCLRMVLAYHSTWFVNSATHIWGYRNYTTTDRSRNLWWVAMLSYGEGWHNNHHAHQRLAVHGHRWWEIDITYNVIRLLRLVGLATKVQDKIPPS